MATADNIPAIAEDSTPRQVISFCTLPPELRNRIYALALIEDTPLHAPAFRHTVRGRGRLCVYRDPLLPPIIAASRQIHEEALAVYYGSNIFIFNGEHTSLDPRMWLDCLLDHFALLRSIVYVRRRRIFTRHFRYGLILEARIAMTMDDRGCLNISYKQSDGEIRSACYCAHKAAVQRMHDLWGEQPRNGNFMVDCITAWSSEVEVKYVGCCAECMGSQADVEVELDKNTKKYGPSGAFRPSK